MTDKQTITLPAETVPVAAEADVVIAGAGTAGFIAATAAARTGAKTLLVDRLGYLGGCTTAPYNTSLSCFADSDGNRIMGGLPWEFMQRMEADGQAFLEPNGRNQIWPVWTRKVALDMAEEAGVRILLHTQITNVVKEGDRLHGLAVHNKAGRGVILGKIFVDCTGDADVAECAGAPFEQEPLETLQQVSSDYIACGVEFDKVRRWALENQELLELKVNGINDHKPAGAQTMLNITIPNKQLCSDGSQSQVGVVPTIKLCVYRDACRIQGNSDIDPLDPWVLTVSETNGLRGALEHLAFMAEQCPGFENAYLAAQTHLGVRETRRIIGDYTLTREDVESQRRFDDVICLNSRGLDFHLKGTVFKYVPVQGNHDIPFRALLPQAVENLIVAGRCISSDHESQASLRGAGACMGTGHAAGTAAALAAKKGCPLRGLEISDLQNRLREQGAILKT